MPMTEIRSLEGTAWVNVYEVFREYGGPEEGGWYYDRGDLVISKQILVEDEEKVVADQEKEYPHTGGYYSVLYSGGDYRIFINDKPGESYGQTRPRWE